MLTRYTYTVQLEHIAVSSCLPLLCPPRFHASQGHPKAFQDWLALTVVPAKLSLDCCLKEALLQSGDNNLVEAHCYGIGRTGQLLSNHIAAGPRLKCKTFRPRRSSSVTMHCN